MHQSLDLTKTITMNFQNFLMKYAGILALVLIFGLTACTDDCADKECGPNSVGCEEGVCICEFGYFGEFCDQIDTTSICDTLVCGDNGITVQNGTDCFCECNEGWEGTNCETETAISFLGTYSATSSCDPGNTFIVTVEESTAIEGGIKFINFSNLVNPSDPTLDFVVNASVDGTTITIFITQDGITVNGTGELTDNGNITLNYSLTDADGNGQTCTDILTAS